MTHTYLMIIAAVMVVIPIFCFAFIWASQFKKVGPNQVLIVSGRKVQLPDGRWVGFRMVKGGGTFVFPVIEKAEVLSLEVMTLTMAQCRARVSGGRGVELDCVAQLKVKGDDVSIIAATEHFLSRSQTEILDIVRPGLEQHLSSVLSRASSEDVTQNPAACAASLQAAAAKDLGRMGLGLVSFTIRDARLI